MKPLRTVAPSCSLSDVELQEQLGLYRTAGAGADVVEWGALCRVVRVADSVPDNVIQSLISIEQACCPFFELDWDRARRCLAISVPTVEHEPALEAIIHALGLS